MSQIVDIRLFGEPAEACPDLARLGLTLACKSPAASASQPVATEIAGAPDSRHRGSILLRYRNRARQHISRQPGWRIDKAALTTAPECQFAACSAATADHDNGPPAYE